MSISKVYTNEERRRISERQLGSKNHMYGKHHTLEARQKLSVANKGAAQPRYKGGYKRRWVWVKAPVGHPCWLKPRSKGWIQEHRLVMEQHLGRYLLPTEVVHHINGDQTDNRIENLQLFENNKAHAKHHIELDRLAGLLSKGL